MDGTGEFNMTTINITDELTISKRYLQDYSVGDIITICGSTTEKYNGKYIIKNVQNGVYDLAPNIAITIKQNSKTKSKIKPTIFDRLNQSKESKAN
jgi:hypothetical protein